MRDSMVFVGGIKIILAVALGFTNYLIFAEIPDAIFHWIQNYIHSKIAFLLVLNVFLLMVGAMMDIFSAIIVVVPSGRTIGIMGGSRQGDGGLGRLGVGAVGGCSATGRAGGRDRHLIGSIRPPTR